MAILSPAHCALVVEDLDEPRQWLVELLPQALPGLERVDAAATLTEARALMAQRRYGLALVDWGLPDGTAESLIRDLAHAVPDAEVIVATIHDDDAHVFPALRAGATGYILKSQPRAVVVAQLQGIKRGEPALSPSVALRVLKHFHAPVPANTAAQIAALFAASHVDENAMPQHLSQREVDVLRLIGKGYNAPEAARLLGLSAHTTSSYIRDIYRKLGISSRAEAAMEAARRGLVG
jgi:DNA-binding NarL/FixJ family response regulator